MQHSLASMENSQDLTQALMLLSSTPLLNIMQNCEQDQWTFYLYNLASLSLHSIKKHRSTRLIFIIPIIYYYSCISVALSYLILIREIFKRTSLNSYYLEILYIFYNLYCNHSNTETCFQNLKLTRLLLSLLKVQSAIIQFLRFSTALNARCSRL